MFKMKCSFIVYESITNVINFCIMTNMHKKLLHFIAYMCTYLLNINKKFCKHSDINSFNCETSKDNCGTVCFLFVSK